MAAGSGTGAGTGRGTGRTGAAVATVAAGGSTQCRLRWKRVPGSETGQPGAAAQSDRSSGTPAAQRFAAVAAIIFSSGTDLA